MPGTWNGPTGDAAPAPRRRRRVVVGLIAVVLVGALVGAGVAEFGGSSSPTVTSAPTTQDRSAARQLLQAALRAARDAGSFHYVSTSYASGAQGGTQKTVGDAGLHAGKQVITAGSQSFTVLVVGTACYLRGNAAALTANLGLSASLAADHAGQWISLAPTDPPYASVYAAVTTNEAISDNITITPDQELVTSGARTPRALVGAIAPVTVAGQTLAVKGTATLKVAAASPHLPVAYSQNGTEGGQRVNAAMTFSRWGEGVAITAPANAVSFASLGTGSGVTPTTGPTVLA